MTCSEIERELVAYHFGLLEGETREAVEAHLATCSACVRAFVGIKRAIETPNATDEARPSASARERLRRAVAREVAPSTLRKMVGASGRVRGRRVGRARRGRSDARDHERSRRAALLRQHGENRAVRGRFRVRFVPIPWRPFGPSPTNPRSRLE